MILIAATTWLLICAAAALAAPLFFKEEALRMTAVEALSPPSSSHWFGTDSLGRDVFFRILLGSTASLGLSVSAVMLSLLLGTWIGAVAGYFGGLRDKILMSLADLFLCFPVFFLILAVISVWGPGLFHIIWILALTGWMGVSRLVRAEVLSLRDREYILAARALGAKPSRILWKHVIPNAMRPVFVSGILGVSGAILTEGALSFLGIGVQPPTPSWGNLLMEGKATLGAAWWLTLFPGLAIFLTVLCLNILGERISDGQAHT